MPKKQNQFFNAIKRFLLRLALGNGTYAYMVRTLCYDKRLPNSKLVDLVVRQDGKERRIEADWMKPLCKIVQSDNDWATTQLGK